LKISTITGRQHQIRAQFSHEKFPIVGDKRYGCRIRFVPSNHPETIALHAWLLEFYDPFNQKYKSIEAPLPNYWNEENSQFPVSCIKHAFDHF